MSRSHVHGFKSIYNSDIFDIKCAEDVAGTPEQAKVFLRAVIIFNISITAQLKPLKCFGNTYSIVVPMKPIKILISVRIGKARKTDGVLACFS